MKKHKSGYFELVKGKNFNTYEDECNYIRRQIDEGKILPVKNSGTNGKKPAMYNYYWIIEPEVDYSGFIYELQYKLNPQINPEYYLAHPEVYAYERDFVLKLSSYLTQNKDDLEVFMSENERSFAIWFLEKFLSGQTQKVMGHSVSANSVLKHCGFDHELLHVYHTVEPFSYYSYSKNTPQNILILENLDPFYSIRRKMMSGKRCFFGIPISTLIYGAGKKVSSTFSGFGLFAEDYMKNKDNNFFYFGDLDYEGIIIFESLRKKMTGIININPFKEAYMALMKDIDIAKLPRSKEMQNKNIGDEFLSCFDENIRGKIKDILESGKYIPQERLSGIDYGDL